MLLHEIGHGKAPRVTTKLGRRGTRSVGAYSSNAADPATHTVIATASTAVDIHTTAPAAVAGPIPHPPAAHSTNSPADTTTKTAFGSQVTPTRRVPRVAPDGSSRMGKSRAVVRHRHLVLSYVRARHGSTADSTIGVCWV